MNAFGTPLKPKKKSRLGLGGYKFDLTLNDGTPIRYVPYFAFLTVLGLIYISNNYYSDKMMRKINALDKEVEILRIDYSTLKYEYIYSSKQSEIAEKVKQYGLIENQKPAYRIPLNDR